MGLVRKNGLLVFVVGDGGSSRSFLNLLFIHMFSMCASLYSFNMSSICFLSVISLVSLLLRVFMSISLLLMSSLRFFSWAEWVYLRFFKFLLCSLCMLSKLFCNSRILVFRFWYSFSLRTTTLSLHSKSLNFQEIV